jgi:hypothetical protein
LASLLLDGPLARAHRAFATSPEKLTAVVPSTLTALLTGSAQRTAKTNPRKTNPRRTNPRK